jgi:phage-related protein
MAREVFNFPMHRPLQSYPQGDQVRFGGGYTFAAKPTEPEQRTFRLMFDGMVWWKNGAGVVDDTVNPTTNMFALLKFYERHKLWKQFDYPHPVHGTVIVRFAKPIEQPDSVTGGSGVTEAFEVTLIEQPL